MVTCLAICILVASENSEPGNVACYVSVTRDGDDATQTGTGRAAWLGTELRSLGSQVLVRRYPSRTEDWLERDDVLAMPPRAPAHAFLSWLRSLGYLRVNGFSYLARRGEKGIAVLNEGGKWQILDAASPGSWEELPDEDWPLLHACPHCGGTGEIPHIEPCPVCGATGKVTCDECDGKGDIVTKEKKGDDIVHSIVPCKKCNGAKTVSCPRCTGQGLLVDKLRWVPCQAQRHFWIDNDRAFQKLYKKNWPHFEPAMKESLEAVTKLKLRRQSHTRKLTEIASSIATFIPAQDTAWLGLGYAATKEFFTWFQESLPQEFTRCKQADRDLKQREKALRACLAKLDAKLETAGTFENRTFRSPPRNLFDDLRSLRALLYGAERLSDIATLREGILTVTLARRRTQGEALIRRWRKQAALTRFEQALKKKLQAESPGLALSEKKKPSLERNRLQVVLAGKKGSGDHELASSVCMAAFDAAERLAAAHPLLREAVRVVAAFPRGENLEVVAEMSKPRYEKLKHIRRKPSWFSDIPKGTLVMFGTMIALLFGVWLLLGRHG